MTNSGCLFLVFELQAVFEAVAPVLNNPLRNLDPNGLAEIPVWDKLSKELQNDLAKRFGGAKNARSVWNDQFDNDKSSRC